MVKLLVDIVKAALVRLVLLVHSLLAVWRVVNIRKDQFYWWLAITDVALIVEGLVSIIARKGQEYKWFCPCFCIYLIGTVPSIWIMELDRRDRILNQMEADQRTTAVTTASPETSSSFTLNITTTTLATTTAKDERVISVGGVSIRIDLDLPPDTWVVVIEQLLLYFMIIGRWLLPRGKISRNELSQLLFVFIGMASDITELFTLFDETPVRESEILTFATLTIWTVSLIQFCFVLTATKNPNRTRVALHENEPKSNSCMSCCKTELWSILVSLCMQDLPFLCLRTYTLVNFRLITYSIIFFTAKNILIVMLLVYRMAVICCSKADDTSEDESVDPSPSSTSLESKSAVDHTSRESSAVSEHTPKSRRETPLRIARQKVSYIEEGRDSRASSGNLNHAYSSPQFRFYSRVRDNQDSMDHELKNWDQRGHNSVPSKYLQSHPHQSPQNSHRDNRNYGQQFNPNGNLVFY